MKFTFGKMILGLSISILLMTAIVGLVRPVGDSVSAEEPSRIVQLEPTRSQGSFNTTVIEDIQTKNIYLIVDGGGNGGMAITKLEGNNQ